MKSGSKILKCPEFGDSDYLIRIHRAHETVARGNLKEVILQLEMLAIIDSSSINGNIIFHDK